MTHHRLQRSAACPAAAALLLSLLAAVATAQPRKELLADPGFEALKAGPVAAADGPTGRWTLPQDTAGQMSVVAGTGHKRSGNQGIECRRSGRYPRALVRQTVGQVAPGLYELTAWARGDGNLTLAAGVDRRTMPLSEKWQKYSLLLDVQSARPVTISLESDGRMEIDDVSLGEADGDRRAAWGRQQAALEQFGFIPEGASAQRPAPGTTARPWAPPGAGVPWKEKVVYFDARYDCVHIRNPQRLAEYLGAAGFARKDAAELGTWVQQKVSGDPSHTVVVMTTGAAPTSVLPHDQGRGSLLFRYLAGGGRVLWLGEMPGIYCQSETSPSIIGHREGLAMFGIRGGWNTLIWGDQKPVELTPLGRRWGLVHPGGSIQGAYVEDVTAALSGFHSDDAAAPAAVSWFKSFCPQHPWSGLIWALKGADLADPATQEEVYRLALYRGKPVEPPKAVRPAEQRPPYGITLTLAPPHDRTCYLRGEVVPVKVALTRNDQAAAKPRRVRCVLLESAKPQAAKEFPVETLPAEAAWPLETADLACGDYRLRAEVFDGDKPLARTERTISICPRRADPEFFFSAWAPNPENPYRCRLALEGMAEHGLHPGNFNQSTDPLLMDQCLRYGLRFSLRTHGDGRGPFEPGSLRAAPDGRHVPSAWGGGRAMQSLASPILRRQAAESFAKHLEHLAGYPALWPYCHTNDDYSVRYGLDYCELARQQFKQKTGLEAPVPPEIEKLGANLGSLWSVRRTPGVVPEDDPWLLWCTFTTRDLGGGFNKALLKGARRTIPGIRLGPVPGGMQLPLWLPGQYPPHQFGADGFNCLWYYYYLNYWQPLVTTLYWDEVARMANRDLPLYVTPGLYGANEPTYYRNMFYLHLAGGVQGMNYFTYQEGLLRPRGLAEVKRLADRVVRPYHPLLGKLRPRRHPVGLLLPYAHAIHEAAYPIQAPYALANLLGAHVDVEPTCEEEVISGDAKRYKAILLWRVKWLRQKTYDGLVQYLRDGGVVLADAFTEVNIPGAKTLRVDFAMGATAPGTPENKPDPAGRDPGIHDYLIPERVRAVRDALGPHLPPEVDSPSSHLVIRHAEAAGVRYLWLVNVHAHEDYEYLRPRIGAGARPENPPRAAEEAVAYLDAKDKTGGGRFTAPVTLPEGCVLYDVLRGGEIPTLDAGGGRVRFVATMKHFGGQLVALYPRRIASLRIETPKSIARCSDARIRVLVLGEDGRPVQGHQPIQVEVAQPGGLAQEWTGSYVTTGGSLEIPIRPAGNHPPGAWEVRVKELSSGKTVAARLQVQ